MKPWLVAVYRRDITQHLELAQAAGWGLEIQAFSHPQVLQEANTLIPAYRALLRDFSGPLSLHGAFFDMSVHSEDPHIIALTRDHFLRNLDIAAELGARHVIFHTNFLPMLRHPRFREQWQARNLDFWSAFADEARQRGVLVALENMWDPDPFLLQGLMSALQREEIGVCLDVSHTQLYGTAYPLATWITTLAPYIIHVHLNNTDGSDDNHLALADPRGCLNYAEIIPVLQRQLPAQAWLVLELDDVNAAAESVRFVLNLASTRLSHRVNCQV